MIQGNKKVCWRLGPCHRCVHAKLNSNVISARGLSASQKILLPLQVQIASVHQMVLQELYRCTTVEEAEEGVVYLDLVFWLENSVGKGNQIALMN